MTTTTRVLAAIALAAWPCVAAAQVAPAPAGGQGPVVPTASGQAPAPQPAAPAQPLVGPPIQRIESASAISTEPLGTVTSVRELRDGRVLVNDGTRRRLLLMDTTLTTLSVVLDSVSEVANTYGTRAGALLPYRGDSILFVDPAAYALVVLDPEGRIVRVRSVWRVEDATYFSGSATLYGVPGLDAKGRVVYRIPARAAPPLVRPPGNVPYLPPTPDSAFVVAVDLDTRHQDTVGVIRIPKTQRNIREMPGGVLFLENVVNPLPLTDDWAVLADGTIAFVRGIDYRIDYLNGDGRWTSSEKLPFEWQRLDDAAKVQMVDSMRVQLQRSAVTSFVSSMIRWVNQYGQGYPEGFTVPEGYTLPVGLPKDWLLPAGVTFPANYVGACAPGVEVAPPAPGTTVSCYPYPATVAGGQAPPPPTIRQPLVWDPLDLPDYRPPFGTSAARADLDGNLWIRITLARPVPGGPVYDVVNRAGELVQRLQLPTGYTLVGFGKGRTVYVTMRDANGLHLARVRLKAPGA